MDTKICLNITIDARDSSLLAQIQEPIASNQGAEVLSDSSYSFTEAAQCRTESRFTSAGMPWRIRGF